MCCTLFRRCMYMLLASLLFSSGASLNSLSQGGWVKTANAERSEEELKSKKKGTRVKSQSPQSVQSKAKRATPKPKAPAQRQIKRSGSSVVSQPASKGSRVKRTSSSKPPPAKIQRTPTRTSTRPTTESSSKSSSSTSTPERRVIGESSPSPQRREVEQRSGSKGTDVSPSKTTMTTTTTTTSKRARTEKRSSKKGTKRSEKSSSKGRRVERRTRDERYDDRYDDRYNDGYDGGSGGYAPSAGGAPRERTCRPEGGHMMINLGIGTQNTQGLEDSTAAYALGIGYRSDMLGLYGEGQFASIEDEQQFTSLRGQLRLYVPLGQCFDLYPLIGLSRFQEGDEQTPAIDLGLGADINLAGIFSLGARYTRSFFTNQIQNVRDDDVKASNTLLFQIGVYF